MSVVVEFGLPSFRHASAVFPDEDHLPVLAERVDVEFTQDYILKVYDLAKATLKSNITQSEIFLFP